MVADYGAEVVVNLVTVHFVPAVQVNAELVTPDQATANLYAV